jgi:YVTN family beta-propeller protein
MAVRIPLTLVIALSALLTLSASSMAEIPVQGHPDPVVGVAGPATTPIAGFVSAMVFDAANGDVYVANWDSSNITVIAGGTGAVVTEVAVGVNPDAIVLDSVQGDIYVANSGSDNVSVISGTTNTVMATINVGIGPCALAFDAESGEVYAANFGSANVSVIDGATSTVVGSIPVANSDDALGVDLSNGFVYVGNYFSTYSVTVINGTTNTVTTTVPTHGNTPWSLAVDSGNGDVYVPLNGSVLPGEVDVIDGATNGALQPVVVGAGPRSVAVDGVNGDVYIANLYSDNVSVISGQTNAVVATVPVGTWPDVVAVDEVSDLIYVANQQSNNVTVINGTTNTVAESVSTGTEPSAIAIDVGTGDVYVSNYGSSNVSEFTAGAHSIRASFTESNAHAGTCQPFTENVTLTGFASGGVPPYSYTWNFGPGSALSYGPEASHTYTTWGSFNVTLSVTDSDKGTASVTQTVDVPPPTSCPIVGGPASTVPWQLYLLFGAALGGMALVGVVAWSRRR